MSTPCHDPLPVTPSRERPEFAKAEYSKECEVIMARVDIPYRDRVIMCGERVRAWQEFFYSGVLPQPLDLPVQEPSSPLHPDWSPEMREIL